MTIGCVKIEQNLKEKNIDFLKSPSLFISGSGFGFITPPKWRFQKKSELNLWASLAKIMYVVFHLAVMHAQLLCIGHFSTLQDKLHKKIVQGGKCLQTF